MSAKIAADDDAIRVIKAQGAIEQRQAKGLKKDMADLNKLSAGLADAGKLKDQSIADAVVTQPPPPP